MPDGSICFLTETRFISYRKRAQRVYIEFCEAKYAQSKADFINKLEIALKESFETEYWLELLYRKNKVAESTYKDLINKCGTIKRKLIASVTTAKRRKE